jgi:hypothetical protein
LKQEKNFKINYLNKSTTTKIIREKGKLTEVRKNEEKKNGLNNLKNIST